MYGVVRKTACLTLMEPKLGVDLLKGSALITRHLIGCVSADNVFASETLRT